MKKILLIAIAVFISCTSVYAGQLKETSIITGFGASEYKVVPIIFQLGYDVKPLASKCKFNPRGDLLFVAEPFTGVITHPRVNGEVGLTFNLKYKERAGRFEPYVEAGVGIMYMTLHTKEQGTQYEFISQCGVGLNYYIKNNLSILGGYRFKHMSNAGTAKDNNGLDNHFFLMGLTFHHNLF